MSKTGLIAVAMVVGLMACGPSAAEIAKTAADEATAARVEADEAAEVAAKFEAAEAARVEAARVKAARVEAARVEAARVEAARVEAAEKRRLDEWHFCRRAESYAPGTTTQDRRDCAYR